MTDQLDKFSTAYLHQRLDYNPIAGIFIWNRRVAINAWERGWNTRFADKQAGKLNIGGYLVITIDGISLKAHRLAWKMSYGETPPPDTDIDHCDRVKVHNWINNLRLATTSQTCQNRGLHSNNTSGIRGVRLDARSGKWIARIGINGKRKESTFVHKEDAIAARQCWELELFGEYSPLINP